MGSLMTHLHAPARLGPSRLPGLVFALGVAVGAAGLTAQEGRTPEAAVVKTALHDFRVETFVPALVHPHSMAFTPEGDMLVTERPGRLRIVRKGQLLPTPVAGLPDVLFLGNGATSQDGRRAGRAARRRAPPADLRPTGCCISATSSRGRTASATSPWPAAASRTTG